MMLVRRLLFLCFYVLCFFQFEKIRGQRTYEQLEKTYENYSENDERALHYVSIYLNKAKSESNYTELKQAYEDYSYYSLDKKSKFKYGDSVIVAAQKSKDSDLLASAYLYKGSLYYFYQKNYQSALDEYLKAYQYSKNSKDNYLKYKVIYQIGLVKNYLGYYDEAIQHFQDCISYFAPITQGNNHPNTIYNSTKGYLNSLHQLAICYQNTERFKKADSIISVGLNFANPNEFPLEKAYFLKSKGILEYHYKKYNLAISILDKGLPTLNRFNDYYWISVSNFYKGKSYLELGDENLAIRQFERVDSLFYKRQFIFPELLENYNFLIKYYHKKKDTRRELEYSKKLLKVDSILNKDFKYLSLKIHKDYDKEILEESKAKLETRNKFGIGTIILLVAILFFVAFLARKYYNNEKQIKFKYNELENKLLRQNDIQQKSKTISLSYENISNYGKAIINENIFKDLQTKLNEFEKSGGFTEKGLSLILLAEKLNTNTSYLSQFINDVKEMNFNKYLSTLRINYITQQMYNDPKFLRLKIQGLADECGISSRQNFSDLFMEINGIRPTDFIKQRKKEIEEMGEDPLPSSPT